MPPKRACDICILRKVKCSGSWPCDTCRDSTRRVRCTYLKPPRRRGPKVRRAVQQSRKLIQPSTPHEEQKDDHVPGTSDTQQSVVLGSPLPLRIPKAVVEPIVRLYQRHSYNVWPVINADVLLEQLDHISFHDAGHVVDGIACLVTALCAATMAQLHLAPVKNDSMAIDSTIMAQICLQVRPRYLNYNMDPDLIDILVSFFLHVYHAKVNRRTAAMIYIQEAISNAKMLRLDKGMLHLSALKIGREFDIISNPSLIFPLLWVSER